MMINQYKELLALIKMSSLKDWYMHEPCQHCGDLTSSYYKNSYEDISMCCVKCYKSIMKKCGVCDKEIYEGDDNHCDICAKAVCYRCILSGDHGRYKPTYERCDMTICIDPICMSMHKPSCDFFNYEQCVSEHKDKVIHSLKRKIKKLQKHIARIEIMDSDTDSSESL